MIETHDLNRFYASFRKENNDYNRFSWLYLNRIGSKLIENENWERLRFTAINSFADFVMISEKSIYLLILLRDNIGEIRSTGGFRGVQWGDRTPLRENFFDFSQQKRTKNKFILLRMHLKMCFCL